MSDRFLRFGYYYFKDGNDPNRSHLWARSGRTLFFSKFSLSIFIFYYYLLLKRKIRCKHRTWRQEMWFIAYHDLFYWLPIKEVNIYIHTHTIKSRVKSQLYVDLTVRWIADMSVSSFVNFFILTYYSLSKRMLNRLFKNQSLFIFVMIDYGYIDMLIEK